jgi:endonuclease/exonuclease/phosphatase family metal-dependent hydrolase
MIHNQNACVRRVLVVLWAMLLVACNLPDEGSFDAEALDTLSPAVIVPGKGTAAALDVATWNIEWFGSSSRGPSDVRLQIRNVRDVIAGADVDIWGLQEIVSVRSFHALVSQLPGFDGLVASDPIVAQGSAYYSPAEQKVGIIYRAGMVEVQDARVILTSHDHAFAGRPPLEVTMRVKIDGVASELVVIVLHAKAMSEKQSWIRRKTASTALKSYLDTTYPTQKVLILGDFNDALDKSITPGHPSPYKNFVEDAANYEFATRQFSTTRSSSLTSYRTVVDHVLGTDEMADMYLAGTAEIYRVDRYITDYRATTSDHYPVIARYDWSGKIISKRKEDGGRRPAQAGLGGGPAQVILNEILANEPGSDTGHEFIELVNAGSTSVALDGWTLSDSARVRHVFAGDTTLLPGQPMVVFASSAAIPSGIDSAVGASTGALSLNNGSDTVILADHTGRIVDQVSYTSPLASADGVSMNRSIDGDPEAGFVLHNAISPLASSPGKRASSADW